MVNSPWSISPSQLLLQSRFIHGEDGEDNNEGAARQNAPQIPSMPPPDTPATNGCTVSLRR